MKRTIKNIIMILVIAALVVCSYFTMKDVQGTGGSEQENSVGQQMAEGSGGMGDSLEKPDGGDSEQETPPDLPDGESTDLEGSTSGGDMEDPPEKPDGDEAMQTGEEQETPPDLPDGESTDLEEGTNGGDMEDVPEKPDGDDMQQPSESGDMQMSSEMQNMGGTNEIEIDVMHYVLFGVEAFVVSILVIYLIMSKFNKLTFKETLQGSSRIIIFILLVIIITALLMVAQIWLTNNAFTGETMDEQMQQPSENMNSSSESVETSGSVQIDSVTETLTGSYTTAESDESVILVENGGNATIDGAVVTKTGGDSSNTENSEFYGVNAGILVTEGSTATITNATISTNAKGSNAVFATGTDAKIYISDSTITTTGSSSARGLDSTYGGYIEADNVTITTQGGSCATLATDRGEGTVIANNSTLETNGSGSPVIYSTGTISITNTQGTANGAQMVVIEGKNSATVTSSTLTASGAGNRGDVDQAGIMIYQSMSGDAGEGTGTFTGVDSSLSIQTDSEYYTTAPMFFITNTDAIINLTNCTLSYGSNVLIRAEGTTEWGNSGSNGGNVTLNAENQILEGNIEIDDISTLTMNLTNSEYTGTINGDNTAKEITLKLDSSSTITLTGDSYITSLEDDDSSYSNINFNGYKLYVNGTAIN